MKCPTCGSEMVYEVVASTADCCGDGSDIYGYRCKCGYVEEDRPSDCDSDD